MPYAESMMSREEVEEELRKYLSTHERPRSGEEMYDFNIKIYRINVPDVVREIKGWTEAQLSDHVESAMADFLKDFVMALMQRYHWIHEWNQAGRMGGWLVFVTDLPVLDMHGEIPLYYEAPSTRNLSRALAPARKRLRDLREIEGLVDRAKRDLVRELEDPKWWGITPKDWRPKKK